VVWPAAIAVAGGLACAALAAPAADPRLAAVIPVIESQIEQSGADVAIAFRTLDGRSQWLLRADEPFHAASTMKLAVLIELYHQLRLHKARLDETLLVRNEFTSLVDGSRFSLSPDDDSEVQLYQAVGERRTLAQLSELMITVSSNLAANLLIDRLGIGNIRASMHTLGADAMNVQRGLEDTKAFQQGLNNTTTANALLKIMDALARGHAVDAAASRQMVEVLARQTDNNEIPAGLPAGLRIAHKTGQITKIQHDAAIVYARRPFVLVILTRGIEDQKKSAALMAQIAHQLYGVTE
jgi:beta-lactamase class A